MSVIATPYALPYRVELDEPPLFSGGRSVLLKITSAMALDAEATRDLESVVTAFSLLASTGAFGGGAAPPHRAEDFEWSGPFIDGDVLQWDLVNCWFDERAAVVLAQMFLLSQPRHPISRAAFTTPGGRTGRLLVDPRVDDPYPSVWQPAPFALRIDRDIFDTVTLRVQFVRAPTPDEQSLIEAQILTWAVATKMGAYGVAPVPPDECSVLFEPSVAFVERELEFDLTRMRAHRASLHGVVNVCIALHHTVSAVESVVIE